MKKTTPTIEATPTTTTEFLVALATKNREKASCDASKKFEVALLATLEKDTRKGVLKGVKTPKTKLTALIKGLLNNEDAIDVDGIKHNTIEEVFNLFKEFRGVTPKLDKKIKVKGRFYALINWGTPKIN